MIVNPGHLPESLLAQVLAAAEAVPPSLFSWAGLILGGGGIIAAIATPIVSARVKKVRQHSDTREDATVETAALTAAVEAWKSFATDAVASQREAAREAVAVARESLADKDRQIEDQKVIIRQYQQLIEDVQSARASDAEALAAAIRKQHDAETKAAELALSRDRLEQRVQAAEAKLVELTLPRDVVERARREARDRHTMHAVD